MKKPTCAKCDKDNPEIEIIIKDDEGEKIHEYFCCYKHFREWCEECICEHW